MKNLKKRRPRPARGIFQKRIGGARPLAAQSASVLSMLKRRQELLPLAAEYAELDAALGRTFTGVPRAQTGPFLITGGWADGFAYELPADLAERFRVPKRRWVTEIVLCRRAGASAGKGGKPRGNDLLQ